jgi:pilus assembly protein CpaC
VRLPQAAKTVFVANPDIADVQVPTPNSFLVYGKMAGTTSVFAIMASGATSSYTVRVTRPAGEITAALHNAVPDAQVTVSTNPGGVTIAGTVESPADAERLKAAAHQYLGDKENVDFDVAVNAPVQVTLQVRVAEVSRNIDKELGVNWDSVIESGSAAVGLMTGRTPLMAAGQFLSAGSSETFGSVGLGYTSHSGKVNIAAVIDSLDQDGLATILAEPTLTAVSGETANFLAGGEYPVPVPQGNQVVTIFYKRYGISVDFTPTVLDASRISIKVRPEVSSLSTAGAVTIDGIVVPSLIVRRAETTVELGSGESFVIAGLFQDSSQNTIKGLIGLDNVPILGALFRSTSFLRNESELVIVVTPYIVKPITRTSDVHLPTDGVAYSSDLDLILRGRLTAPARSAPAAAVPVLAAGQPGLRGPAGFILE